MCSRSLVAANAAFCCEHGRVTFVADLQITSKVRTIAEGDFEWCFT
jgi:hypothetical protein